MVLVESCASCVRWVVHYYYYTVIGKEFFLSVV